MGAVINLAGLLADIPHAQASAVDGLPHDVIDVLTLDVNWMKANFPEADSFINVA